MIYGYVDENVGDRRRPSSPYAWSTTWSRREPDFDFEAELETFIVRAERTAFGPSTQAIIDEAVSRDIPWIRLNQHSLVQLGQGVHAKRIRATMTSETSSIAVDIASDKDLTGTLLSAAGLPVPKQDSVRTADQAVSRPQRGSATRWWSSRSTATTAAASASTCRTRTTSARRSRSREEQSRRGWVIVESFVTGKDYRCLVIDGKIAAIAERVPAHVDRRRHVAPSRSWSTSPTPTRDAASATRRC